MKNMSFAIFNGKKISDLDVDEVYKWSLENGLDKYGIPEILKKNDVDGPLLVSLSDCDMKNQLNINSFGARHHLKALITSQPLAVERESMSVKDYGMGQYLSQVPLLENLTPCDRARIGAHVKTLTFKANSNLVKQGQKQTNFHIIREGVCRVRVRDPITGRSRMVARLHIGDFFGEEGLVRQERAPATVVSETDVTCWAVEIKFCRALLRKSRIVRVVPHREAISAEEMATLVENAPQKSIRAKSEDTKNIIETALKKGYLFDDITKEQVNACTEHMWKQEVPVGDCPIKQGESGDFFYVVESGEFEILIKDDKGFTVRAGVKGPVSTFGELALMYNAPRAATVKATAESIVWVLDRRNFRRILLYTNGVEMQQRETFLKTVPEFKHLFPPEISSVANACENIYKEPKDIIVKQGEMGDIFYIIESGTVQVIKNDKVVKELTKGAYFGERALIEDEARAATIKCVTKVKVLSLGRNAFRLLLGPLLEIMKRKGEVDYSVSGGEMATKVTSSDDKVYDECTVEHAELESIAVLGSGAFGQVRLVSNNNKKNRKDNDIKTYALKKVSIKKVRSSGQVQHIKNERNLMLKCNSRFIVHLYKTFTSKSNLYFLMEACLGGELFTYLRDGGAMDPSDSKFYIGCVVLAFEHIHTHNIIYRDLKPENLMIDDKGYLKVTDFGFAKQIRGRTFTLCGTPDYLAPEVIAGKGHAYGADWWTLGILTFELLNSFPPFYDTDHMKTYRRILRENIKYPLHFSSCAKLFMSGLLQKKCTQRLGVVKGGVGRVKKHRWFQGFEWEKLAKGEMKPPIVPKIKDPLDFSNFDKYKDPSRGRLSTFASASFDKFTD